MLWEIIKALALMFKACRSLFFVIVLLLSCSSKAWAYSYLGVVDYVLDGDTCSVREGQVYHRVRLASIDAPEKDQPYGVEAARLLRRLVDKRMVLVTVLDVDKYGREVGRVQCSEAVEAAEFVDVNCYLLAKGAAWHWAYFDRQGPYYSLHKRLESEARAAKLGLWGIGAAVEPWRWRNSP